jgi:murein DD-endopeptidase MepM/ murein hydrolase activator NlpD
MPLRPGDGAGGRDHGAPRFGPRSRLSLLLPGVSRGGNRLLGIALAGFIGLAQVPAFDAPSAGTGAAENRLALTGPLVPSGSAVASDLPIVAPTRPREAQAVTARAALARIPTTRRSVDPERLTGYRWPLRYATITTWFAPTDRGFVVIRGKRVHDGIDLATFCGNVVRAAHSGTVLHAGREFDRYVGYNVPPEGFYKRVNNLTVLPIVVVVDDGNGYRSLYVHLGTAFVRAGQRVKAGQPLGREGATGRASGCHLHYSLIRMDGGFHAVAPEFVKSAGYPPFVRERVDPLRVLSFLQRGAPRQIPGIPPPVPPIR